MSGATPARYEVYDSLTGKKVGEFSPSRAGYWASKFVSWYADGSAYVALASGQWRCAPKGNTP